MSIPPLRRLDDNRWSYFPEVVQQTPLREIQIITPSFKEVAFNFLFAQAVAELLYDSDIHDSSQLENGLILAIENAPPKLLGTWKISLAPPDDPFWQSIPMTRMIRDKHIAVVTADKYENTLFENTLFANKVYRPKPFSFPKIVSQQPLGAKLFEDPFTRLATLFGQTADPFFVSERTIQAALRFVLHAQSEITLEELPEQPFTEEELQENRAVVAFYKEMTLREHGASKIAYVEADFGFSFDELIATGAPLVPDHVFKTNIGMNKIELGDVQNIYNSLLFVKQSIEQNVPFDLEQIFCAKELRKLFQKTGGGSNAELLAFLQPFFTTVVDSVKQLDPALFNCLVELVMPTKEERERSFTGRKIHLYAISGSITLGNPDISNPSSELFDVLQIFDQLETTENWENYCELHAHITPKKSLYFKDSPAPDSDWHVGMLIPGPKSQEGQARWYYNEAFIDDNGGGVTYLLQPACDGYRFQGKPLPFINVDRPTATCRNCINWLESVAADLNPYASPSSLYPKNSFYYHKKYIDERTIPLWVGYLLLAEKSADATYYQKAIAEYHECLKAPGNPPPHKVARAALLHTSGHHTSIREFLFEEAELHRELPEFKIEQSIYWIGQSLGGAMGQFHTYYYGPRRHRIPLPGYIYHCYSSRGPAIDTYQDTRFMDFGREHRDLIAGLGPRWIVRQDLEYGDVFPQFGESHLGTTGYEETTDALWLDANFTVFKPLETAETLAITTFPTHGRRTGLAVAGRDYEIKQITPALLSELDHSWWMTGEVHETFGYVYMRSSKIAEIARTVFSFIAEPFMQLALWIHEYLWPAIGNRDINGVWFLQYQQPQPIPWLMT